MVANLSVNYKAIRVKTFMAELPALNIRKILLAEDDDEDYDLLNSAVLSIYSSVDILRTTNGIMLSSIMESSISPDLIILDINMPFKNGISCLKEIKSNPKFAKTKVVMFSTTCLQKDIDTCYELGADFFIVKPNTYSKIIEQFKALFLHPYFIKEERTPRDEFLLLKDPFYSC